jgi:hypothetical protein
MEIHALLSRLRKVRDHGAYYTACCPAHEDNNPSLSITESTRQQLILLKCHAGCGLDKILAALELSRSDLRLDPTPPSYRRRGMPIAWYDYTDSGGHLLYQKVRYVPKRFSQRSPRPDSPRVKSGKTLPEDQWIERVPESIPRVLYHLPKLLADPKSPVYLVEGEKDVESMESHGFLATSAFSSHWLEHYSDCLRGRDVVIIPDNDEPGIQYGLSAAKSLIAHGCCVRWLPLSIGGTEVKDATEFFEKGGKAEFIEDAWFDLKPVTAAFVAKMLAAFTAKNGVNGHADIPAALREEGDDPGPSDDTLHFHGNRLSWFLAYVEPEDAQLLPPAYLTRREITVIAGPGGLGKSRLIWQLAINHTLSQPWLDLETHGPPCTWLFLGQENSPARMKADFTRILPSLGPEQKDLLEKHLVFETLE